MGERSDPGLPLCMSSNTIQAHADFDALLAAGATAENAASGQGAEHKPDYAQQQRP
jgi:hypothetical protein